MSKNATEAIDKIPLKPTLVDLKPQESKIVHFKDDNEVFQFDETILSQQHFVDDIPHEELVIDTKQVVSIMSTSVPIDIQLNKPEFVASRPFNRKQSVI